MNGRARAAVVEVTNDDALLGDDEGGAEPEAWEAQDQLLADMKALTASLLKAEAAVGDREAAADEQKDHLHDGLTRGLASIVAAIAAGDDLEPSTAKLDDAHIQPTEAPTAEEMHVFPAEEAAPRAEAAPPHAPPTREPLLEAAPLRRASESGGVQRTAAAQKPPRFKPAALPTDTPTTSIMSEVSRLASKPLLPPAAAAVPQRRPGRQPAR